MTKTTSEEVVQRIESVPLLRLSTELANKITDNSSVITSLTIIPSENSATDLGEIKINRRNLLMNTYHSQQAPILPQKSTAKSGSSSNKSFAAVWRHNGIFQSDRLKENEAIDLVENASVWCSTAPSGGKFSTLKIVSLILISTSKIFNIKI